MADARIHPTRHRRRRRRSSATARRVWHWVHVCAGARIGARLLARPERLRRQRRGDRQQRQDPEQRLGLRRRHARGRRVLRPEHGLHQRLQPARGGRRARTNTGARWCGAARRSAPTARSSAASTDRRATPSSAPAPSSTATCPTYALVVGVPARQIGWMSRFGERLDLPRRAATARPPARTRGDRYRLDGARAADVHRDRLSDRVHRPEGAVRGAAATRSTRASSACSTTASTSWARRSSELEAALAALHRRAALRHRAPAAPRRC